MAEVSNPIGCVGRILTLIGVAWIALALLAGAGVLSRLGFGPGQVAFVGGNIIPGLVILWLGRAFNRRARTMEQGKAPVPAAAPRPAPPPARPPRPVETVVKEPARSLDQVLEEELGVDVPEGAPPGGSPGVPAPGPVAASGRPRPKTSQELVEEAKRKWGGRPSPEYRRPGG